jgi:putative transcriptional regulator
MSIRTGPPVAATWQVRPKSRDRLGCDGPIRAVDTNNALCKHNISSLESDDFVTSLYNRIALFRAERGVSRRELAEAVGVNNQTIGYLERGDYKPSLELAMKIAAYFDVPIELLFSFRAFESVADTLRRAAAAGERPL